jgi:hypothetical protein
MSKSEEIFCACEYVLARLPNRMEARVRYYEIYSE